MSTGTFVSGQTVTYTPTDEDFTNPDRGFYYPTITTASNFIPLNAADLISKRTVFYTPWQANYQVKTSVVFRYYVLDSFVAVDTLSDNFLNLLEADFATARQAGVRLVIRFSYINSPDSSCGQEFCTPYGDAPKSIVLSHIAELKPIFQNNSDVISAVQNGFIGIWGEQYYTDHFGDASVQGKLFDADWQNRIDVLAALLDAVPSNRMVQVRYPQMKQKYIYGIDAAVSSGAMTESQAHNASDIARIGFHNDCFLSSSNDFGTYFDYGSDATPASDQTAILKAYAGDDAKFVAVGGETCNDGFSPQNDCAGQALSDMSALHFSYLNSDYNNAVNNDWQTDGCMDEIKEKLGYRIEMLNGTYPSSATQNIPFSFELNLENRGFAAPYNEKEIQLILRDQSTNQEYQIPFTGPLSDVRKWYTGPITLTESISIPNAIPPGTYNLLLHILEPSQFYSLANRAEYSIRLANTGTWESSTGYNNLNHQLTVIESTTTDPVCINIDGNFSDWDAVPAISSSGFGGLVDFKVADDADYIYAYVGGVMNEHFQLYIDVDNDNIGTNEYNNTQWFNTGLNYMIEDGSLFQYTGTGVDWSWNLIGSALVNETIGGIEIQIEKVLLSTLSNSINFGFVSLDVDYNEIGHIPNATSASLYSLLSFVVDCNSSCANDPLVLSGSLITSTAYETNGLIETNQTLANAIDVTFDSQVSVEFTAGFTTGSTTTIHAYIEGCE